MRAVLTNVLLFLFVLSVIAGWIAFLVFVRRRQRAVSDYLLRHTPPAPHARGGATEARAVRSTGGRAE